MKSLVAGCLAVIGLACVPGVLWAQVESGPAVKNKVEPLKVAVATGDDAGKDVEFSARRKNDPTIYVFVQADKWDRPQARFLKVLDTELGKDRADVHVVVVWLTDDVNKAKEYLPKAQMSLKLERTTFTVHPGDRNGPAGWAINGDAHLTAVVAAEGRVAASFGYLSVNETDVPAVLKKLPPKK
jgi:hypothetical protein